MVPPRGASKSVMDTSGAAKDPFRIHTTENSRGDGPILCPADMEK